MHPSISISSIPSHLISPINPMPIPKVHPISVQYPPIPTAPFHKIQRKTVPPNNVQTHLDWAPVENLSAAAADRWLATVSPPPSLRLQVLPRRLKPPSLFNLHHTAAASKFAVTQEKVQRYPISRQTQRRIPIQDRGNHTKNNARSLAR